jgi:hypothetical protein
VSCLRMYTFLQVGYQIVATACRKVEQITSFDLEKKLDLSRGDRTILCFSFTKKKFETKVLLGNGKKNPASGLFKEEASVCTYYKTPPAHTPNFTRNTK